MSTTTPLAPPSSDSSESALPEIKNKPRPEKRAQERSGSPDRRLALVLFIATFLGSLLGLAADLSDASGLVLPIVEFINPAPQLRIAGSNTVLGEGIAMAAAWRQAFEQQKQWQLNLPLIGAIERTVRLTVEPVGSGGGFEQAARGEVDLLVASEPIPQHQYDALTSAGLSIRCAAEIGYDVIAFITDINNTVPEIETRDMASILNGTVTNWSEVGGKEVPIRLLVRQMSGTTDLVLQKFTGSGEFRPHFIACESNSQCLDMALTTPGSLYWVSTAWLRTQPPRYLRLILIQRGPGQAAEDPLKEIKGEERFDPDEYTVELIRPLFMYVLSGPSIPPESTTLAQEFLYYVRGVRGQEILEDHYFYTHFDPPSDIQVELPPGFGAGSNGLPIICRKPALE